MGNTLIVPEVVASESLLQLTENFVMAGLCHRDHQTEFSGSKKGDKITIRRPATFTTDEFDGTINIQDVSEGGLTLALEKHFDISVSVTSKQWTLELDDFSIQVIAPAMQSIAGAIDAYVLDQYKAIPYFSGTPGNPPSSLADLADVDRELNENLVPVPTRYAVVNPAGKAQMLGIDAVVHAEKRGDGGEALQRANMGEIFGLEWYMSQGVKRHTAGTWSASGTWTLSGKGITGETTLNIQGGTGTETLNRGDIFLVAGDSKPYVVTTDTAALAGVVTNLQVYPAVRYDLLSNSAITVIGSHDANLAAHRNALALAVVPLELPQGNSRAAYASDMGVGIRVVFDYDINSKTDTISFDVLCGARAIQPELAARILG